ncbi:MAG: hypothetical protein IT385_12735 [Deltaproteobacteria bacterium]|nr:hypothetical protein [Deltaproteobacteria bacterium]
MPVMALCLALVWSAAPDPEPTPMPPLERARLCWAALDAECAEAALVEARAGLAALAPGERLAVLVMSAEVALSADRGDAAREHLRAALEIEPRLAPAWPEAWLATLAEVRRTMPDRLPPTIRLELPDSLPPKRPALVRVHVDDPSGVSRVVVRVGGRELVCATTDGLLWQVEVPREMVKIPDLTVEAVAADRLGNEASERAVVAVVPPIAPPTRDPPVTSRWWFWTAIGVGVAAIATTVALVVDGGAGEGSAAVDGAILLDVEVDPEPSR